MKSIWRFTGCEVQGRGHRKKGTPCQDKTFQLNKSGVYVIALADGAGSAKLSHYGAECVVKNIAIFMTENFQKCIDCEDAQAVASQIVNELRDKLSIQACDLGCEIKDLASTLLFVAVNRNQYIFGHIGDGVIGYFADDELKVASLPNNGEFANVTTFVTSHNAQYSMRLGKGNLNNISAFFLMSDGLACSLYNKAHQRFALILKRIINKTWMLDEKRIKYQLEKLFSSEIAERTQDDCSIAVLARPNKTLYYFEDLYLQDCQEMLQDFNLGQKFREQIGVRRFSQTRRMNDHILKFIYAKSKGERTFENVLLRGVVTKNGVKIIKEPSRLRRGRF